MTLRWLTIPMAYVVLAGTPVVAHALKVATESVAVTRSAPVAARPGAALYPEIADSMTMRTWIGTLAGSIAGVVMSLEAIARRDDEPLQAPEAVQVGTLR